MTLTHYLSDVNLEEKKRMGDKEIKTAGVARQTSLAWALLRAGPGVCWKTLGADSGQGSSPFCLSPQIQTPNIWFFWFSVSHLCLWV